MDSDNMAEQRTHWNSDPPSNFSDCPNGSRWIMTVLSECAVDGRDVSSVYLGLISILCFFFASFPQYYRSCKTGNMDKALSIWFLLGWLAGDTCNLVGAFLSHQLPLQTYTAIYYVIADLVMLILYIYFKYRNLGLTSSLGINSVCGFVLFGSLAAISLHRGVGRPLVDSEVRIHSRMLLSYDGSGSTSFSNQDIIGMAIGSVSSILYLGSRLPQIVTNFRRKSTEGLALSLFCLVILGNLFYGLSILLKNPDNGQSESDYILHHLPWIVGSLGVMSLDVFIIFQFFTFSKIAERISAIHQPASCNCAFSVTSLALTWHSLRRRRNIAIPVNHGVNAAWVSVIGVPAGHGIGRQGYAIMQSESDGKAESAVLVQSLNEPGRFAYAGLCALSLAQLFPEKEQRTFCTEFVQELVRWLDLSVSVVPAMVAFASGFGGEGTETFTQVLMGDSVLKTNPAIITQDLVSFCLREGYYDARSRVLISHVSWLLRVPPETMEICEESLLKSLKQYTDKPSESTQESRRKKENRKKLKRYLLIGLATVGGGTVIGLTGGLAAPFIAAGAATIIGSAGAAALASTAGIAIMASLFGAAGAGLTGYKMKKRVGAIEEFEFLPLTGGRQLHISIAVTGWLSTGKYGSFVAPWQSLLHSTEQYCLAWESKYLMELGNALDTLLNGIMNMVAQEALKFTVLSGIVTALTWPASLITVASVIDNPWGVCLSRSAEVGKHLAHILLTRQQGKRPVTLIGFSLGARVLYFCLQELAQEAGAEGIIEDVVLLGAPVEGDVKKWKLLTRVVAGRIINGYCRGDWLLSFVYRSSSVKMSVAGLQPINLDDRRMVNVDLSSVVKGHLDYMKQMDTILKAVGIKTKECRFEEQNSLLYNPPIPMAEELNRVPPMDSAVDPDTSWNWEPVTSTETSNSLTRQDSVSEPETTDLEPQEALQSLCIKCSTTERTKPPCADCTNNNDTRLYKQRDTTEQRHKIKEQ
ncbi:transmembrane and coiled-coil domain-containing 4 [Pelobates cultripes]|uniref:Lysosomal amino acid transporter 1 homolog n=1 Tax=Pelobates cultripes TaxID=61616 RepID=A0AAD1T386_PELCU|nr:transmembrane and coiled-coil domain-containing 4 [Pelobates cultripes]